MTSLSLVVRIYIRVFYENYDWYIYDLCMTLTNVGLRGVVLSHPCDALTISVSQTISQAYQRVFSSFRMSYRDCQEPDRSYFANVSLDRVLKYCAVLYTLILEVVIEVRVCRCVWLWSVGRMSRILALGVLDTLLSVRTGGCLTVLFVFCICISLFSPRVARVWAKGGKAGTGQ